MTNERIDWEIPLQEMCLEILDGDRSARDIVNYVKNLLFERNAALREKVEGMKKVPNPNKSLKQYVVGNIDGWNEAMDSVIALLDEDI